MGERTLTGADAVVAALAAAGEAWASRQPLLVIATDVPTGVRRHGVWRGALHETSDQAAMFAPVVKATRRIAEALGKAVVAAGLEAQVPPARPVYVEVPTALLSA